MVQKTKTKSDIIIPIYNAYDCLSECIDSVINNTDLKENNLILIDDQSTDKRVLPLLEKYHKENPNINLLKNKKNLGFVATVNRGMKLSKNDVLLLNSDTVVTPRWLEKIKECAYSGEMIATVTPLSNNATLASVPKIFERNELPKGMSIDEMGELVERCSYKDYPEIPTAHGFCMYIKRSVLEEVGYFDEETFGKGYGEENDFCFRCFDVGYRHLLCDDTYIYHKESQSFSNDKEELLKNSAEVLDKKYPSYRNKLSFWCSRNPIRYIGENISFELGRINKRINILFLIHDWKNVEKNLGGTTLHAYDLIRNLRDKYNFHVFAPEDGIYKLYSYWEKTETVLDFPGVINFKDFNYYNGDYKSIVSRIVKDFDIRVVHIHHMKGHYFDIKDIIRENKLYSIFTAHDYYAVCPLINKMYKLEKYCGNPTPEMCGECLHSVLGYQNNMIFNWRHNWLSLLGLVNKIITPSEAAKQELLMTFPKLKVYVVEHGVDLERIESKLDIDDSGIRNIAFVGVIAKHKGSEILRYLVETAKMKNVKIHLFGITDKKLRIRNSKYFVDHGPYKREDLPNLLTKNKIHLVCLFSMWPETYTYTLTESISSGVPVLGVSLGAVGERVKKFGLGWLIEPDAKPQEYVEKIKSIFNNPSEYSKIIANINSYSIRSTREMAQKYSGIYSATEPSGNYNKMKIKGKIKDSNEFQYATSIPAYPNYSWVFDTLKWKIIDKFKIPKSIKKLYRKIRSR